MLRPIAVIQKKDGFRLGYKSNRQERQRFLEKKRQKRVASFLGKEAESMKIDIPPLSFSFLLAGFINPEMLQGNEEEVMVETFGGSSIDMVEVEDQRVTDTGLPPFSRGQVLNNWTSVELFVVFKFPNV